MSLAHLLECLRISAECTVAKDAVQEENVNMMKGMRTYEVPFGEQFLCTKMFMMRT
jgi:hypothetical protein